MGLGDVQDPRDEEGPAVQELNDLKALVALADKMVSAIRRCDVARNVGDRAYTVHIEGARILRGWVALHQDADRPLLADCLLRGRDRTRPADRYRHDDAWKQYEISHRHDDERVGRQRRHAGRPIDIGGAWRRLAPVRARFEELGHVSFNRGTSPFSAR